MRDFTQPGIMARKRRNSATAVASLLAHAAALLLIPGFVVPQAAPQPLIIELTTPTDPLPIERFTPPLITERPVQGGLDGSNDKRATAPKIDRQIRPDAPPAPKPSGSPKSGKPATKQKATSPEKGTGGVPNQPQAKSPSPSQDGAGKTPAGGSKPSDSTDVVPPAPVSVPAEKGTVPRKVDEKPAAVDNKTADKPRSAEKGSSDGPAKAPPQKRPGKSGDGGGSGGGATETGAPSSGGDASGQPAGTPGGTGQGGAGDPGKAPGGGPATAPELGPPASPPGPSDAEIALLEAYGDKCLKKIRQLARNPETAREQGHKGKVKFEFTMSSRGKLLGVSIVGGAGYKELEEETRDATRVALGSFERFPKGVSVEKWTFTRSLEFPLY